MYNPFIRLKIADPSGNDRTRIINWKNITHCESYNDVSGERSVPQLTVNFIGGPTMQLTGSDCQSFLDTLNSIQEQQETALSAGSSSKK